MASTIEKSGAYIVRVLAFAFMLPYIFVGLTWIMPVGFIPLVPFIALGVWSQWDSVQNFAVARKFRRELDAGLPSVQDRDRL